MEDAQLLLSSLLVSIRSRAIVALYPAIDSGVVGSVHELNAWCDGFLQSLRPSTKVAGLEDVWATAVGVFREEVEIPALGRLKKRLSEREDGDAGNSSRQSVDAGSHRCSMDSGFFSRGSDSASVSGSVTPSDVSRSPSVNAHPRNRDSSTSQNRMSILTHARTSSFSSDSDSPERRPIPDAIALRYASPLRPVLPPKNELVTPPGSPPSTRVPPPRTVSTVLPSDLTDFAKPTRSVKRSRSNPSIKRPLSSFDSGPTSVVSSPTTYADPGMEVFARQLQDSGVSLPLGRPLPSRALPTTLESVPSPKVGLMPPMRRHASSNWHLTNPLHAHVATPPSEPLSAADLAALRNRPISLPVPPRTTGAQTNPAPTVPQTESTGHQQIALPLPPTGNPPTYHGAHAPFPLTLTRPQPPSQAVLTDVHALINLLHLLPPHYTPAATLHALVPPNQETVVRLLASRPREHVAAVARAFADTTGHGLAPLVRARYASPGAQGGGGAGAECVPAMLGALAAGSSEEVEVGWVEEAVGRGGVGVVDKVALMECFVGGDVERMCGLWEMGHPGRGMAGVVVGCVQGGLFGDFLRIVIETTRDHVDQYSPEFTARSFHNFLHVDLKNEPFVATDLMRILCSRTYPHLKTALAMFQSFTVNGVPQTKLMSTLVGKVSMVEWLENPALFVARSYQAALAGPMPLSSLPSFAPVDHRWLVRLAVRHRDRPFAAQVKEAYRSLQGGGELTARIAAR
ncbi:hypothetical protein HK101_003042, partial [Irineochytrium annulatum]